MKREIFYENRSTIILTLVAFAILLVVSAVVSVTVYSVVRQNGNKLDAELQTLTYTETKAEAELADLQVWTKEALLSEPKRGQLYKAMAELSYMTGNDMQYNEYVADALYYLQRSEDDVSYIYLCNKYIGRLYANGCYQSAETLLGRMREKTEISDLPLNMQASYYLSCIDVAQMAGSSDNEFYANAKAALQLMPDSSERSLDKAKLDLLTARSQIKAGDFNGAQTTIAGYSQDDSFGFEKDQVYVICDFLIPYEEIMTKLALHRKDMAQVNQYAQAYMKHCDDYNFRAMKLRLLKSITADASSETIADIDEFRKMERIVSEQNLTEMTDEYGQFLLSDLDTSGAEIAKQEQREASIRFRIILIVGLLYVAIIIYCVGSVILNYINKDELTQLNNRKKYEMIRVECERRHLPHWMLMLDIDDFKKVNDRHGHDVGDTVLKGIGAVLRRYTGRGIFAYRYGGEELCMVMIRVPKKRVLEIAEEIRSFIENTQWDCVERVTVSIGLAESTDGHNAFQDADHMLYEAKKRGKNQVCWEGMSSDEQKTGEKE